MQSQICLQIQIRIIQGQNDAVRPNIGLVRQLHTAASNHQVQRAEEQQAINEGLAEEFVANLERVLTVSDRT